MMMKLSKLAGLLALACAGSLHAAPVLVTTPAGLGNVDTVGWAQLGADGTAVGTSFSATSAGGRAVSGALSGLGCSGSVNSAIDCGWAQGTGFANGDHVLIAADANVAGTGNGSGPLTLSFAALKGAGLYFQTSAFGAFTATIEAFNGATSLGLLSEASDSAGSGLFLGVLDSIADITSITVSLSCANGCDNSFGVNSLLLAIPRETTVPEPSTWALVLAPLGVLMYRRRQSKAVIVNTGEVA